MALAHGRTRHAVECGGAVRAGDGEGEVGVEAHLEGKDLRLDAGGTVEVAEEQVAGEERQPVHRPGGADPPADGLEAAEVLHAGEGTLREDLDHLRISATVKTMLSPG